MSIISMKIVIITSGGQSIIIDVDPADTSDEVKAKVDSMADGTIVVLENVRFYKEETTNESANYAKYRPIRVSELAFSTMGENTHESILEK